MLSTHTVVVMSADDCTAPAIVGFAVRDTVPALCVALTHLNSHQSVFRGAGPAYRRNHGLWFRRFLDGHTCPTRNCGSGRVPICRLASPAAYLPGLLPMRVYLLSFSVEGGRGEVCLIGAGLEIGFSAQLLSAATQGSVLSSSLRFSMLAVQS